MMKPRRKNAGIGRSAPLMLAAAGLMLAAPTAVLAFGGTAGFGQLVSPGLATFTPASVDPKIARSVAEQLGNRGKLVRFTPAGGASAQERTVTVAVRVDGEAARAISVRSAIDAVKGEPGRADVLGITQTSYNLGVARGYQSFTKPAPALGVGVQKIDMPDLAEFEPSKGVAKDKPGRLQPRIQLEQDSARGRAPRTLQSMGEQSVDLGGSYRLTRNLDVTAGVRISQDRERLAPLTDSVQDSQAVYVGTQFRF